MAEYTGTMYVGGDIYSETAKGYQIAGDDLASANATISLPSTYSSYESCSITCTFYSATAPANWNDDWCCYLNLYKNKYPYANLSTVIDKNAFEKGIGSSSRYVEIELSGGYFEDGDEVTIEFANYNGGYVDSSNRCVYLTGATFYSAEAVLKYKLSFSSNGGSGAPSYIAREADDSGYVTITIPSKVPTRDGYAFLGWALKSEATSAVYEPGDDIDINQDTMLYAVWKEITYTVTYDDNGADSGLAPTDSTEYQSGATVVIMGNTGNLIREGYVFAGWNNAADGSGTTYVEGDSLDITSVVALYALWVADERVFIFTGSAWQKGEPQIFNGTTWQAGELSLYANYTWNS